MYRCFQCDAPAECNCACYTQVEVPQPQQEQEIKRVNIASGEDVVLEELYDYA